MRLHCMKGLDMLSVSCLHLINQVASGRADVASPLPFNTLPPICTQCSNVYKKLSFKYNCATVFLNVTADEGSTATASCGPGRAISGITSSVFGVPGGTCNSTNSYS